MKAKAKIFVCSMLAIIALFCLYAIIRVFFFDRFTTKGVSMEPTLKTGDVVVVNKMLMGARIYTRYDFTGAELHSFRLPGLRKPKVGDLVVYNYPEGWEDGKIGFKINYVCCKRCIGCPGDSISIEKGIYHNSRVEDVDMPMVHQEQLSRMDAEDMKGQHIARLAYYFAQPGLWTIKDFGPLYIPAKGDTLVLDSLNVRLYGKEIEFETGTRPSIGNDFHVFQNNWYFFGGDNVLNSRDSRYLGLVPEPFIIGIVMRLNNNYFN